MSRALILGDIGLDIIFELKDEPLPDTSVAAQNAYLRPGGVGGNIASWLSYLGSSAILMGSVGKDAIGSELLHELNTYNNLDYSRVKKLDRVPTGVMAILLIGGIKKIIAFRGANMLTWYEDWEIREALDKAEVTHVSGYYSLNRDNGKLLLKFLSSSKKSNITTTIDLEGVATENKAFFLKLKGLVDYALLNLKELKSIFPSLSIKEGAEKLTSFLKARASVIKMGEDGVLIYVRQKGISHHIPAVKPKEVVDPTGAGDAFNAGFIHGLLKGYDVVRSAELGCLAGSKAVSIIGSKPSSLRHDTL